MGIEKFFNSIDKNLIANLDDEFTYKLEKKLDTKYLLIDFNSIVHITSVQVISDINYLLYQVIKQTNAGQSMANYFSSGINVKTTKIINAYSLQFIDKFDVDTLKNTLTPAKLDELILNKVKEYVLNMLLNFVNGDNLKYLYIAIDGVPNKTKMIEQKKRRYMGAIINNLKSQIFIKHEPELINDKNRYMYEKNKFSWSKINISPGTPFIHKLNGMLNNLKTDIHKICPKLKKYVVSGTDEFGEGEKKIVDYFDDKIKVKGPVTIYSPDSDMTLLCLLLSNKIHNLFIIRHNQQQNNYDIVNVVTLRKNLCNYVINALNLKKVDIKLNCDNIIDDIVFVLTIFGNDFLPKIESVNVRTDFTKIIDKYIKLLENGKQYIIINLDDKNKKLNQPIFIELMKLLHNHEGSNLQNIYIDNHYHNYNKLKKILGAENDNFVIMMNDFLHKLRIFNKNVRTHKLSYQYWLQEQTTFIDTLKKLTILHKENITNNEDFIKLYMEYYNINNKLPKIRVQLLRYSKSINDSFYRNKLEKSLDNIDNTLKITKYDEEIFKLDNMLDDYINKLNAKPLDLGYVSVDIKTYTWKTEPINKSAEKYYKNMFGVNMNNVNVIVEEYIRGLVWVFDYYYNKNNTANIWFYKYNNVPLLTQIYKYLVEIKDDNYLMKLQTSLDKYKIDINKFFSEDEHLMYVSPINLFPEIIPKKYNNVTLSKLKYIDTNKIVSNIMTKENSGEIDCRGITFLNKCHVAELHIENDIMESHKLDMEFIKILDSKN
jgi:5'-3' exonuclease